jgi:deoxyadenosine/deoxycytidine kinase
MGVLHHESLLEHWRNAMTSEHSKSTISLLTICGPSGAGKTTVATSLSQGCQVYVETTAGNPHLKALLAGKKNFNAAANQEWFIDRVAQFVSRADDSPMVLDQDPAAVVFGYAKMFCEEGYLTCADFERLVNKLVALELQLRRWKGPRNVLFLHAPPEMRRQRVIQRGAVSVPPLSWFEKIGEYFHELANQIPNVTRFSTAEGTIAEAVARAQKLLAPNSGS